MTARHAFCAESRKEVPHSPVSVLDGLDGGQAVGVISVQVQLEEPLQLPSEGTIRRESEHSTTPKRCVFFGNKSHVFSLALRIQHHETKSLTRFEMVHFCWKSMMPMKYASGPTTRYTYTN
jgi:hypothetical protein